MTDQPQCVDRERLRSLAFDAFPSEVAVLDRDGVILETNDSWEPFARDNGVAVHPDVVGENYLAAVAREAWSHVATADATLTVESTARFEADESLLSQLLENLFRNAVENAGEDARVVIGQLDGVAGFYVADDGPGIPPDRSEAVFEAGYTTNSDEGGTGSGLAIVERIADAHGWTVHVTDAERGGARFEFAGVTSVS